MNMESYGKYTLEWNQNLKGSFTKHHKDGGVGSAKFVCLPTS